MRCRGGDIPTQQCCHTLVLDFQCLIRQFRHQAFTAYLTSLALSRLASFLALSRLPRPPPPTHTFFPPPSLSNSVQHAPIAMGAAGARVVVAESYARIFFRNSIATGEVNAHGETPPSRPDSPLPGKAGSYTSRERALVGVVCVVVSNEQY